MSTADVALRYHVTHEIGLGHAARALTLSHALEEYGKVARHVVPEQAREILINRGVPQHAITTIESEEWEILQCHNTHIILDTLWRGNAPDTAHEIHQLKEKTHAHVTVIDSMPPDHYACAKWQKEPDLLVTPYHRADAFRPAPIHSNWLFGSEYSLLGTEYQKLKATSKQPESHHRILVCTGGSDSDSLSLRIVRSILSRTPKEDIEVDVVVGPLFPSELRDALSHIASSENTIHLHWQPPSIAHLLHKATLVAGRPGLIRYESACLGTPSIMLAANEHYRAYYELFNEDGLAEIHFQADPSGEFEFMRRLRSLIKAKPAQNHYAGKKVDGMGAQRLINALLT